MDKPPLFHASLSKTELEMFRDVFLKTPELARAWLFGSRAKGTAETASDIDIAVEGLKHNLEVEALRERLNDLPMPYTVDVQSVENITNSALREHINRCGVLLFEQNKN